MEANIGGGSRKFLQIETCLSILYYTHSTNQRFFEVWAADQYAHSN